MASQEIDPELVKALQRKVDHLSRQIGRIHDRLDQLEFENKTLVTNLPTQQRSKREKKRAILIRLRRDAPDDAPRGAIDRNTAAGAADCTKRHVRTLFRELDEAYPWASYDMCVQPCRLTVDVDMHTLEDLLSIHFQPDGDPP